MFVESIFVPSKIGARKTYHYFSSYFVELYHDYMSQIRAELSNRLVERVYGLCLDCCVDLRMVNGASVGG